MMMVNTSLKDIEDTGAIRSPAHLATTDNTYFPDFHECSSHDKVSEKTLLYMKLI